MRTLSSFAALGLVLATAGGAHSANRPNGAQSSAEGPITAASKEVPEAFLYALLKKYADGNAPLDQGEDPMDFFTASTAALVAKVQAKDEAPAFDVDPFCDCQDWNSLRVKTVSGKKGDATHAILRVEMMGDSKVVQTYKLVREENGWRVDDIYHPTSGSMLARLNKQ